jgi:hypothetical protein
MRNIEDCQGCYSMYLAKTTGGFCTYYLLEMTDLCPCRECLVKSMCNLVCSIYTDKYRKNLGLPKNDRVKK